MNFIYIEKKNYAITKGIYLLSQGHLLNEPYLPIFFFFYNKISSTLFPCLLMSIKVADMIVLISDQNICYEHSLEPSWPDGSNEGSQPIFIRRNVENNLCPFLCGALYKKQ